MKVKRLFFLIIFLFSFPVYADYRWIIVGHVVEPNGHVYRGYDGFDSGGIFKEKQVIYFEQERGQKISFNQDVASIDNSTANKYSMVFSIQDKSGDEFSAEFKFFKNELE